MRLVGMLAAVGALGALRAARAQTPSASPSPILLSYVKVGDGMGGITTGTLPDGTSFGCACTCCGSLARRERLGA